MSNPYCDCDVLPPHGIDYHDRVVKALEEDPNQHFVIREGVVYLVEPEDLLQELAESEVEDNG
jgi:hypothetical protein